jgi:hypothetical protein
LVEFVTDVDSWDRKGRGKSFQFFATDCELAEVLGYSLPARFAPYSLMAVKKEMLEGRFVQRPIHFEIDDFLEQRRKGAWRFFLRSHVLTPELHVPEGIPIDRLFAFNGFLNVFHGAMHRGRISASVVGVVDRITHRATQQTIHHKHYVEIFQSVKSGITPLMRYRSVFSRGSVPFEDPSILISEKAAALHRRQEVLLEAEPGSAV